MPAGQSDPILRRARVDLFLPEGGERGDTYLWEHSLRIVEMATRIGRICLDSTTKYDPLALRIAALYHDAGWIIQVRNKEISRTEVLTRPTSPDQRVLAAELLATRMADLVPALSLQRAMRIVMQLNDRHQTLPEGQVLSEAETLDQIGLLSLWPAIRKQLLEGRDIRNFLDQWRRQIEYKFWEARINETIRFEPIRILARQRLRKLTEFIENVACLQECSDLDEMAIQSQH